MDPGTPVILPLAPTAPTTERPRSQDETDAIKSALGWHRDRQFAEMLTVMIGLAAETHPEELRRALGKVFDLEAIEESHRRMTVLMQRALDAIADIQSQVAGAGDDVKWMSKRVDQIHERLDKAAKAFDSLKKRNPVGAK